jgi:hypothetical protein
MQITYREKLVQAEIALTKLGIHEVGGNNHGPWVKKFLAEVGLPEGYPWCDALQSYAEHSVYGKKLPIESASVLNTYDAARTLGWTRTVPQRGDLVCYSWSGHAPFGDHIGLVLSATSVGPFWRLQTVEGNTSSGDAGSQGDGDGVFIRNRVVSKASVGFIEIPEPLPPKPVAKKPVAVKKVKPAPEQVSENGKGQATVPKPKPKPKKT